MDKFLLIPIKMYKLHIVVTWETNIKEVEKYAFKYKVELSEKWKEQFNEEECDGFCMNFGENNTDIIIWLKEYPKRMRQFGVLYHEIYHAVDYIKEDKGLEGEIESPAYLYEYIVNECNKLFWK